MCANLFFSSGLEMSKLEKNLLTTSSVHLKDIHTIHHTKGINHSLGFIPFVFTMTSKREHSVREKKMCQEKKWTHKVLWNHIQK